MIAVKRAEPGGIPWLRIEKDAPEPLIDQVFEKIQAQILRGTLRRGRRLPSTRAISEVLGISRGTVAAAFERLMANGLLEGRVGSGTYVAASASAPRPGHVSAKQWQAEIELPPFTLGPTLDFFPFGIWQDIAAEQLRNMRRLSAPGDPAGYQPLRAAIADFSRRVRGIACSPAQVIITMGATQALDLVVRSVTCPGDVVVIEDPSDPRVWSTIANARATPFAIPVDEGGLSIHALDNAKLPPGGLRLVSMTAVRQYPLGMALSADRQAQLLHRLESTGSWLVELEGTMSLAPPRDPLIANRDINAGRLIYHASLSWVLFRALRMGYVIAPESLVPALLATRRFMDVHPAVLEQAILAEFIARGHMETYLERMQAINAERHTHLCACWQEQAVAGATLSSHAGGLGQAILLPDHVDDETLAAAARQRGLAPVALSSWYGTAQQRGLLLGFAAHPPARTAEAIATLAPLVTTALNQRH